MDSLRLEKSYKLVGRELSIEYAALESGLDRFVDFDKGPFLGRDALIAWSGKGFENRLVTLEVQGVTDADARGSEPVMKRRRDDRPHDLRRLRLADREIAGAGDGEAGVLECRRARSTSAFSARPRRAVVVADSPYDPKNAALRA